MPEIATSHANRLSPFSASDATTAITVCISRYMSITRSTPTSSWIL
jgi:hypothetical protein